MSDTDQESFPQTAAIFYQNKTTYLTTEDMGICRALLAAGAPGKKMEDSGRGVSPLHSAKRGNEMCLFLIEAGADVGQVDNSGMSPLHAAAAAGRGDACEILLNSITPHHPDKEGRGGTCGPAQVVTVGRFQVGPR